MRRLPLAIIMRKILIILSFVLIILSCSRNKYEKELIGQWDSSPAGIFFTFFEDSAVVVLPFEDLYWSGNWDASSSKINLHYPKEMQWTSLKNPFYYNLNTNKDSLVIKTSSDLESFVVLKVENHWKHYLKEIGLDINLPEANFELTRDDSMPAENDIDLFIAYKKDNLVIKSYEGIQLNNFNNFKAFVVAEKASIRDELIDKMNFNLIVDRMVTEREVDSIKNL